MINKIYEFVKTLENNVTLNGYEIILPDRNITIELCGLITHCELNVDKYYLLNKLKSNENKTLFIWEDDWRDREDIIKSMIMNKLNLNNNKIYARKLKIKEMISSKDTKKCSDFINQTHIQGNVGSKIKLALLDDNDDICAIMTFGVKRKFMNQTAKDGEWELMRYCGKKYTNIVGGASKLFKHFVKNYNVTSVNTFADRIYSEGDLYNTLNFTFQSETEPNYYYVVDGHRKHRFGYRKDVLITKGWGTTEDTEHSIMLSKNLYRVFNAGNYKFTYFNEKPI